MEKGGRTLSIAIQTIWVHGVRDEIDAAFAAMVSERADAVYVQGTCPASSPSIWRLNIAYRLSA